ncbi:MAG: signal peptidase I [Thermococcus sp.]|nr:signal peptidase I [Thermococcus sp.]
MVRFRKGIISLVSYFPLFFLVLALILHFVFGFHYVVILTNSMEPHINPGDLVIVRPVEEVSPGDVVLYRLELQGTEYRIIHRIVEVRTDENGRIYYVTKGDNREYTDPWRVYPSQIIGKPLLVIPYVGRLYYYLPLGVTALILALIALVGYELVKTLLDELEKTEKESISSFKKLGEGYGPRSSRRPGKGKF